jgi:hypothetical protein
MEAPMAQWLAAEWSSLGIHFQNWMPVAAAIVVLAILYQFTRKRLTRFTKQDCPD